MDYQQSPSAYRNFLELLFGVEFNFRDCMFGVFMAITLGFAVSIYTLTKLIPRLHHETRITGQVIQGITLAIITFLIISDLSSIITGRAQAVSDAFDGLVYSIFRSLNDTFTSPGYSIWVQLRYVLWIGFERIFRAFLGPRAWDRVFRIPPFEATYDIIILIALAFLMPSWQKVNLADVKAAWRIGPREAARRALVQPLLIINEEVWIARIMNRKRREEPTRPALDWQETFGNPSHQDPANKALEVDCPICYEGIKRRSYTYTCPHTQCDNSFHRRCIKRLHRSAIGSDNCPLCRRPTRLRSTEGVDLGST